MFERDENISDDEHHDHAVNMLKILAFTLACTFIVPEVFIHFFVFLSQGNHPVEEIRIFAQNSG